MNKLLDELKKHKPTKPMAFIKIDRDIPAWFRLIKGAKFKTIYRWHIDRSYKQFQFQVRDLSDGKFKVMTLSEFAFKRLGAVIDNMSRNDQNPNDFNFCIVKQGEGFRTTYYIVPRERNKL